MDAAVLTYVLEAIYRRFGLRHMAMYVAAHIIFRRTGDVEAYITAILRSGHSIQSLRDVVLLADILDACMNEANIAYAMFYEDSKEWETTLSTTVADIRFPDLDV